ncbi:MAG TPA: NAD(P)/FAD-dependent oxidoreductase [Solirubrobacteraceae bacterium]|nr:NAD(P)/FAD-dependent oxidoreductase [Solirubrobacteraceae bacterium]
MPDAVVVGAGPNGLAAAIALARAGRSVRVLEAEPTVGGGSRSAELTLPGFVHDICSAVHPHPLASPFLRQLPLDRHGLELVHPEIPLAHPLDDGTAVLLERSVAATGASIGGVDGRAYERMMDPLVRDTEKLLPAIFGPLRPSRHPLALVRFGALGLLRPVDGLARARFEGPRGRALLAGLAAHSMLRMDERPSAAVALVLALAAHAVGWPVARGGSQRVADALTDHLRSLGGEVETGRRVESVDELGNPRTVMLDVTPRQVLALAGHRLPAVYRRELSRFRYGPGVFKLDWALDGPIPWRAPECTGAGTVHLGGTLEEIAASEAAVVAGRIPERPYVLMAQQSACDPTRAPAGQHTGWAYCHVPSGSPEDMTERIEAQVERFAPGFRDRVVARSAIGPAALEHYNANYIGGDINGGRQDLRQLFTRPAIRPVPYATPDPRLYICSSSTPPGGGVHGMCGYHAAQAALRRS